MRISVITLKSGDQMRLTIGEFWRLVVASIILIAAFGPVAAIVRAEEPKTATALTIESVAFMAGTWEYVDGSMAIEERWSPVAGGTMLGTGRTVSGDKTVFFEFLRIEGRADGVFYVAQPKGRHPGTEFKLVRAGEREAVFENLAHDFPKRIIYRKEADGGLTARVEGDGTEKEKPQEYRYRPAAR